MVGDQVRINLLGTLEVTRIEPTGCHSMHITAAKRRQVLAMLAANANTMVTIDQLIDELWPQNPPSTVKTIVQTYVYQLRKLFGEASRCSTASSVLATRPGGYLLSVPRENVDIFQLGLLHG